MGKGFILLVMFFFIVGLVNALEFDNIKQYDANSKTVTIKDSILGIPTTTVATIQLKTPLEVYVMHGLDRKVAEFTIDLYENSYDNPISKMDIVARYGKTLDREVRYKYKTYEDVVVDVPDETKTECQMISIGNNITREYCYEKIISFKKGTERREKWVDFDSSTMTKGNLTIGVFTEVKQYDNKVEWIPTFFGVEVNEWAVWTASLNVNLTGYWTFNSDFTDSLGRSNGSGIDNAVIVGGCKMSGCVSLDGTGDYVTIEHKAYLQPVRPFSISLWINATSIPASVQLVGKTDTGPTYEYDLRLTGTAANIDLVKYSVAAQSKAFGSALSVKTWYHIVAVQDSTKVMYYLNGVNFANNSEASAFLLGPSAFNMTIGDSPAGDSAGFNGLIDEVAIWNRSLSSEEVVQIWNNGLGISYSTDFNFLTITLNSPPAFTNYSVNSVIFNCSATDETGVWNLTLIIDGSNNYTISNTTANENLSLQTTVTNIGEGSHTWTCSASDGEVLRSTAVRYIYIDTVRPTLTITYPNSSIIRDDIAYDNNNTRYFNYTIYDTNIKTCIFYNGTYNVSNTCGTNVTLNLPYDNFIFRIFANDTFGNQNSKEVNVTYNYMIFVDSIGYNAKTYETATELLTLSMTYDSVGYSGISANVIYNNSIFPASKSGTGNSVTFSKYVSVPLVDTNLKNMSFFWEIKLSNSTGVFDYNTTILKQAVVNLSMDNCSVYGTPLLNYTLKDEEFRTLLTESTLNTSIQIEVNISSRTASKRFSVGFNNQSTVQVCLSNNITTANSTMNVITKYDADGYAPEYHYLQNFTLNNRTIPQYATLYDILESSDVKEFIINVKDSNFLPIENAVVIIQRKYILTGKETVEMSLTDEDGKAKVHLDTDNVLYGVIVMKNGEVILSKDSIVVYCQSEITPECVISLDATSTTESLIDYYTYHNLYYSMTFNDTTRVITVTFTTIDLSEDTVSLNLTKADNYGNVTICSEQRISSSGDLICTIPISYRNVSFYSSLYNNGELVLRRLYRITPDKETLFGNSAIFLSLLLVLTIPMMFIPFPIGVMIGGIIGLIAGSLLLYTTKSIIGATSVIVWVIILFLIIAWRYRRR